MQIIPADVVTPLFTYERQVKTVCNQPGCEFETVFFKSDSDAARKLAEQHMSDEHGVLYDEAAQAFVADPPVRDLAGWVAL